MRIGVVKRGCLAPQIWLLKMFKTLTAFPEGKHDDQVVALGLVGQLMDKYVPGHVPKKEPENEKWPHAVVAIGCDARKGYETFRRSALADIPQCMAISALGQKQTYAVHQPMSALPPIATANADFRKRPVCFTLESGHVHCTRPCLLWAKSGH